jgi:hypothetical protein
MRGVECHDTVVPWGGGPFVFPACRKHFGARCDGHRSANRECRPKELDPRGEVG